MHLSLAVGEREKEKQVVEELLVWRLLLGNYRFCSLTQLHDLELEVVGDYRKPEGY